MTLLARLRDPADEAAWLCFESRYRSLIVRFSVRQGMQAADAEDVAQAVFASLLSAMRGFRFDATRGRFRDYLFRAVRNEIFLQSSRLRRPNAGKADLFHDGRGTSKGSDARVADVSQQVFEDEWINHHMRLAFETVRQTHAVESIAIFEQLLSGQTVTVIAAQFSTTEQAVHKVKQRIRVRMRELVAMQIAEEHS